MKFPKNRRCDYCRAAATSWIFYKQRAYPSGRIDVCNSSACDAHINCPAFESMRRLSDAAPIVKAMRDVPTERRMDAVAIAVDAFCKTRGDLV